MRNFIYNYQVRYTNRAIILIVKERHIECINLFEYRIKTCNYDF